MPPKRPTKPPAKRPPKAAKGKGPCIERGSVAEPFQPAKGAAGAEPQKTPNANHEKCCEEAWKALCEGVFTYRAIARMVNATTGCSHDHKWVKAALERHSQLVEATVDNGAVSARAQYLQGLYFDLTAQAILARSAAKEADRIRARREMTEIRAKIAAARGVVTQRAAHEVSGTLQVDHGSEAIESLTRAIASIAARSRQERGNSQSDAGTGEGASD